MSISRSFDDYVAINRIKVSAEVIPESACEQFEGEVPDPIGDARRLLEEELRSS